MTWWSSKRAWGRRGRPTPQAWRTSSREGDQVCMSESMWWCTRTAYNTMSTRLRRNTLMTCVPN
jgi:hypothetical protein